MQLTTTFRLLRKAKACTPRYEFLRNALSREEYDDDTPIDLLTILETNGLEDALWALKATSENCDKVARLMAADFAEQVLPIWEKYSTDQSPALCIKAVRDFANGLITQNQLEAAADAARTEAWAARAEVWTTAEAEAAQAAWAAEAAWAARAAAWAAPWDAGREKQKEIFIGYLQPEEPSCTQTKS